MSPITAFYWARGEKYLKDQGGSGIKALLQPNGKAPQAGQLQKNPDLAATFRSLGEHGAEEGKSNDTASRLGDCFPFSCPRTSPMTKQTPAPKLHF